MSHKRNRRLFERRKINRHVRFITRADMEASGQIEDISEGGLRMTTDAVANVGDEIIVYPEGLGRLTGAIVRKEGKSIAIQFEISDSQREHLTKRILSAQSGVPYLRILENRSDKRAKINVESTAEVVEGGAKFECAIVDISSGGAAIRSEVRPPLNKEIRIGSIRGRVCRHTSNGFAITFIQQAVA